MKTVKKQICVILFLITALDLWSLPFIGADTGLLFIVNTEEGGAPSPVILQGIGATFPLIADEGFYLDTSLLLYGASYQYLGNRAIPADIERSDTVWVLFVQLDLRTGFNAKLSDDLLFGATVGPALIFPFPLFATDNGAQYIDPMYSFFFLNLKFIYAETELFLRWAIARDRNLAFSI